MHEQNIIDDLLSGVEASDVKIITVSLTASPEVLEKRLRKDIENGLRDSSIIERSIERLPLYEKLNTVKIDTDNLTAKQVAEEIIKITVSEGCVIRQ